MNETRRVKLDELIREWHDRRRVGDVHAPEDLCRGCPEYLDELRVRIEAEERGVHSASTLKELDSLPIPLPHSTETPEIEGYLIEGKLGQGGMGVVYKARQLSVNRTVALKMLRDRGPATGREVERFRREAEALGLLQHPNIVQIFEVREHQGRPLLVMEHVEGGSLAERLLKESLTPRQAAELTATLARAVEAAHRRQILHRDLKPANILLTPEGSPKIADFGLAKNLGHESMETPSGVILGTPCYMAPEQACATGIVGPRSDVYSLGAILYELLAGRPPFRGDTPAATIGDVLVKTPTPVHDSRADVPRVLEAICLKCLEKEPTRRYSSAADLADDLDRWLAGRPTRVRPPGTIARVGRFFRDRPLWALAALGLLLLGVYLVESSLTAPPQRLKQLRQEMGDNRTLTLIGETGPPRWHSWVVGEANSEVILKRGRLTSLKAFRVSMLELTPEITHQQYRIEAEVLHSDVGLEDAAGFYFARIERRDGTTVHHYLYDLTIPGIPADGKRKPPSLNLRRITQSEDGTQENHKYTFVLRRPEELPPAEPDEWRRIGIEVTPENLIVRESGRRIGEVSMKEIRTEAGLWLGHTAPKPVSYPGFASEGGMGLYAARASARFRSVTIEPLPER